LETIYDIDFGLLPKQFILKCTHDSGGMVICKDKETFNMTAAKAKINLCLKRNYFWHGREWPYRYVKPRIIAEPYLEDNSGELMDYKVFNFNGQPKVIQVDYDRFSGHKRNLYTPQWERIKATIAYPTDFTQEFDKPKELSRILELSKVLSAGFIHLRSDFYIVNGKVYFGELTFYHGSGMEKFIPEEWNDIFGSWIKLPIDY
jgi:hypothetical protein